MDLGGHDKNRISVVPVKVFALGSGQIHGAPESQPWAAGQLHYLVQHQR